LLRLLVVVAAGRPGRDHDRDGDNIDGKVDEAVKALMEGCFPGEETDVGWEAFNTAIAEFMVCTLP
jgi:hypothetical protein